jgi:hypothetical protein
MSIGGAAGGDRGDEPARADFLQLSPSEAGLIRVAMALASV